MESVAPLVTSSRRTAPWLRFVWPPAVILVWIAALTSEAIFFWVKVLEWLPSNRPDWAIVWALAWVAVPITLFVGAVVGGAGRAPWYMRMGSFALGSVGATVALVLTYVGYMIAAPDPQATNDDMSAVGAAFLSIPTFAAVTVPLFVGGGLGSLVAGILRKATARRARLTD